ncbi:MAG: TRAM domain-containing protein [Clostridiales bacterium]|nr:TRAM domain-containing protein [Clostridiales bacterium]
MKSKFLKNLLRALLYAAGAGAGTVAAFLCVQVHDMTSDDPLALWLLVLLYVGMSALGVLIAHLLVPRIAAGWTSLMADLEKHTSSLTTPQLISMSIWLLGGLLIASLVTQILHFLGESIFTMAVSAILYVALGVIGLTIGAHRAEDMATLMETGHTRRGKKAAGAKVLDASVLMDGRIAAVARTGILTGPLLTADFVVAELREMAASADAAQRLRGQRGLETIQALQADANALTVEATEGAAPLETDVALMALVREKGAMLLTADALMHKAARVAGLSVVNLNDLAMALRSVKSAGDVVHVHLTKEGREAGQAVGYLEDGTMIVVEGGSALIGSTVEVSVTSVLQTSAGRMVFAKLCE